MKRNQPRCSTVKAVALFLFWTAVIAPVPSSAFQVHSPCRLGNRLARSTIPSVKLPRTVSSSPSKPETTTTSLSATTSPLLAALGSPLGSVAVLAGVVLVHEAGHYLAARSLGIAVEEFSVGVGPRLFGFRAFGDEFNLRALPLGGYVRFPENYNATLVEQMREKAMEQQVKLELENEESKNSALSGLMNVFTLGAYGRKRRQEEAKISVSVEAESWWSRLFKNNNDDVPDKSERSENFAIEYYDDPNLPQNRPWPQRALVLSGGVVFNLLLAFTIFFGEIHNGNGLPQAVFERGAVVSSIPRPDAACSGILKSGDVIVSINGAPLTESQSPNAAAAQQGISDFIAKIRATPEGESLNLAVVRANSMSSRAEDVVVVPKRLVDDLGNEGPQSIGAMLRPNLVKTTLVRSDSILEAARLAAKGVTELTSETANGLLVFFATLVQGRSAGVGQSVTGPIGLIRQGSEIVSTSDFTAIFTFAAALSVNLAVVNALPLPALDGGQLVFVLAEAITGRKINQRLEEGITSIAVLFLLLLTVGTAVGDLESLLTGR